MPGVIKRPAGRKSGRPEGRPPCLDTIRNNVRGVDAEKASVRAGFRAFLVSKLTKPPACVTMGLRHQPTNTNKGANSLHVEYNTPGPECQALASADHLESLGEINKEFQKYSSERLRDIRKNGTERPWRKHHRGSLTLASLYEYMAVSGGTDGEIPPRAGKYLERSRALANCAPWAEFETQKDAKRLTNASFCRVRLCPMCQWRRSLKLGTQARQVVDFVGQSQSVRWLLLTVTLKNVPADSLGDTVTHLHQSLTRLTHKKAWPAIGWLRATEVTYNAKSDTFHPHMHLLLCVKPSYFAGREYISQKQWRIIWRNAARLDYDPQVDIRTVKPDNTGIGGVVAEVTKYATKPADIIRPWDVDTSCKVIAALDKWLDGRRLTSWGGILKDAAKQLQLDDIETGDFINLGENDPFEDKTTISHYIVYKWAIGWGDYVRFEEWDGQPIEQQRAARREDRAIATAIRAENDSRVHDLFRASKGEI